MQFLTYEQASREPYSAQYRHSPAMALVGFVISMIAAVGAAVLGYNVWTESRIFGIVLTGWLELVSLLFALLLWGVLRSRLLPSNWLVRAHANGLSIKFRSYLNHHFDASDTIVVFIRYSEIEYVRAHRIRQDVPGSSRGDTETRFVRFAEFNVRDEADLARLDQQLAVERARRGPQIGRWIRHRTMSPDYPVQIKDGFLRVQWQVWPRLPQFMNDIASRVAVHDAIKTKDDFRQLKSAAPKDQEDALLQLIAAGDRFGAIRVIKEIYGYDTTRAVQFLEELTKTQALPAKGSDAP